MRCSLIITFVVEEETKLTGTFTANADECILFTIPWDEGWNCFIDGNQVDINKTWDLFMSVDVPEGKHTYEMKFFPAWMNYGLIATGVATIALFVSMLVWRKSRSASYIDCTLVSNSIISDDSASEVTFAPRRAVADEGHSANDRVAVEDLGNGSEQT